jgi:hypothetical protein
MIAADAAAEKEMGLCGMQKGVLKAVNLKTPPLCG